MRSDAPEFIPRRNLEIRPLNPDARPFYPASYDALSTPPPPAVVSFTHQSLEGIVKPPKPIEEDVGPPPEFATEDRKTSLDGRQIEPTPRRVLDRGDYYMEAEVEGVLYETLNSDDNSKTRPPPRRRVPRQPRRPPRAPKPYKRPRDPTPPPPEEEAPPLSTQLSESQPDAWRWRPVEGRTGPSYSDVARHAELRPEETIESPRPPTPPPKPSWTERVLNAAPKTISPPEVAKPEPVEPEAPVPPMSQVPAKKTRFSKFAALCQSHQASGPSSDPFTLHPRRGTESHVPPPSSPASKKEHFPRLEAATRLQSHANESTASKERDESEASEHHVSEESPAEGPPVEVPIAEEPPAEVLTAEEPPAKVPTAEEPPAEVLTAEEPPAQVPEDSPKETESSSTVVAISAEEVTVETEEEEPRKVPTGLPSMRMSTSLLFSKVLGAKTALLLASLDEADTLGSPRVEEEESPPEEAVGPEDGKWPYPTRSSENGRVVWAVESLLAVRGFPSCNQRPDINALADVLLPSGSARKTVQFLSSFGSRVQRRAGGDGMWDLKSASHNLGSVLKNSSGISMMKPTRKRDELWRVEQVPIEVPENAWVVQQKKEKEEGDELKLVARRLRGLLNRMTEERFDSLYMEMLELITRPEEAKTLISLVFEKATTQHTYVRMYAYLTCKLDTDLKERGIFSKEDNDFRHMILQECQDAHQRNLNTKFEAPPEYSEEDTFEELLKYKLRIKGNLKLTGELLVRGMMAPKVGFNIMEELLNSREEQQVEALASFMGTVGYYYERSGRVRPKTMQQYHAYVARVSELAHDEELPTRLRCLLKDVLEARTMNMEDVS